MPKHVAMRDAIRQTWLNPVYWDFSNRGANVLIHPLFLLGTQRGFDLTDEARENNDILQYDFIESHYNLTVKEMNLKDIDFQQINVTRINSIFSILLNATERNILLLRDATVLEIF